MIICNDQLLIENRTSEKQIVVWDGTIGGFY